PSSVFLLLIRPPPISTLFPYTTLFRSLGLDDDDAVGRAGPIYRGRRGRLEHLDRLELLHVQVCEPVHQRILSAADARGGRTGARDRKSTRLNSSHSQISYAVFCLKKKR